MSGVQKPCPICKVTVEPGLDGSCTGCGVSLDDVLESVDLDTAAMSFDAACASCGGLLMGATDACPLCGVALPADLPAPEPAPVMDTFVPEMFVPVPADIAEPGDTYIPPIESFITPTDGMADTVVSVPALAAEPEPSAPAPETLGAPAPASAEDAELWSGLPVSWEKGGANGGAPSPASEVITEVESVPPETAPMEDPPLMVGAVPSAPVPARPMVSRARPTIAPARSSRAAPPPAPELTLSAPEPGPEPPPLQPLPAPILAPAAPPWQGPPKDAPLELDSRKPKKTTWEQRWERAESGPKAPRTRRVERRTVAVALLFIGFLAATAVGAAQWGLLGSAPDETRVDAATETPAADGSVTALAATATPNAAETAVAIAGTPKPAATPVAPTPESTTATTAVVIAATPKPAATATAIVATQTPKPTATALAIIATPTTKPTATAVAIIATPTPKPTATAVAITSTPKPTATAAATVATPKATPTATAVAFIATPPPATPAATSAAASAGDARSAAVQRGQTLIQQGKIDEAVRELKKLVKDDDGFSDGHYHLGSAYAYQGEFNKACAEFKRYLKMAPQGTYAPSARASLANCP